MTYTRTYTINERALQAMETQSRVRINATGVEGVIREMYTTVKEPAKLRVMIMTDDGEIHHAALRFGDIQFQ